MYCRSKMGATLTERYEMKDKGTKKLTTDFEKLRKDLKKVILSLLYMVWINCLWHDNWSRYINNLKTSCDRRPLWCNYIILVHFYFVHELSVTNFLKTNMYIFKSLRLTNRLESSRVILPYIYRRGELGAISCHTHTCSYITSIILSFITKFWCIHLQEQETSEKLQVALNSARLTSEQHAHTIEQLREQLNHAESRPSTAHMDQKTWKATAVTKLNEEKVTRLTAELDNKVCLYCLIFLWLSQYCLIFTKLFFFWLLRYSAFAFSRALCCDWCCSCLMLGGLLDYTDMNSCVTLL